MLKETIFWQEQFSLTGPYTILLCGGALYAECFAKKNPGRGSAGTEGRIAVCDTQKSAIVFKKSAYIT